MSSSVKNRLERLERIFHGREIPESVSCEMQRLDEAPDEFESRIAKMRTDGKKVIPITVVDASMKESENEY